MTDRLEADISIPFPSSREAEIASGTLSVDAEPKRSGVRKTIQVHDNLLQVHFEAKEARALRVGVNSFFDHLNLVIQTLQQYGPPREPS